MAFRSFKHAVAVTLFACFTAFAFQNCGAILPGGGPVGTVRQSPGNGQGYEGMQEPPPVSAGFASIRYVLHGACVDGSDVDSSIHIVGGEFLLDRQNCADLNPAVLVPAADVQSDPADPTLLIYGGEEFRREN